MWFPFCRNRDSLKNGTLISIRRTGDGFHPGLFRKVIMHEDTDVLLSDYALLKVDEEEYSKLDRQYILRTKKESYGYSCLTNQKQYYAENYPQMAIEKGNIDEVITMMIRGVE